jgi:DNA replicative helicase MCM subunit Mcm2 (Cdc46/Mcm family)
VVDLARDLGEPVPLQYALVVPKLSSSMARKERKFEIEKREIDKSLDLFENLFEEGIRMTKESSKFEIRKLSDDERLVYFTMKDLGGEKREITLKELKYNVEISEAKLKIALEMLRDRGLVYMPRRGQYRLVPLD